MYVYVTMYLSTMHACMHVYIYLSCMLVDLHVCMLVDLYECMKEFIHVKQV